MHIMGGMSARLTTGRLSLRPLEPHDTDTVLALGGDAAIAETMISVPHPLAKTDVERWVSYGAAAHDEAPHRYFAACLKEADEAIGVVALRHIDREHRQAELSFWVGRPFWGRGYASEAAEPMVVHAFTTLDLNRLEAYHMLRNAASGRVLERLGFVREGVLRERVFKGGRFEDVAVCARLRSQADAR